MLADEIMKATHCSHSNIRLHDKLIKGLKIVPSEIVKNLTHQKAEFCAIF